MIVGVGAASYGVNQMSLHQHLTPMNRFGRATAARRFLLFGLAAGAAIGGFCGVALGLRATLTAEAVGFVVSFLLLFLSPARQLQSLSTSDTSAP